MFIVSESLVSQLVQTHFDVWMRFMRSVKAARRSLGQQCFIVPWDCQVNSGQILFCGRHFVMKVAHVKSNIVITEDNLINRIIRGCSLKLQK